MKRRNANRIAAKLNHALIARLVGQVLDEKERRLPVWRVCRDAHGESTGFRAATGSHRMEGVTHLAVDLRKARVARHGRDLERIQMHGGIALQEGRRSFTEAEGLDADRAGLCDVTHELGSLHGFGRIHDRVPLVVEDLPAQWGEMQQPACSHLMAGLSARGQCRDACVMQLGHRRGQFVIGGRHFNALLFEDVLAVGKDRGLGPERNSIERAGNPGHVSLLATDNAAVLQVGTGNIIDVILRVDQRA